MNNYLSGVSMAARRSICYAKLAVLIVTIRDKPEAEFTLPAMAAEGGEQFLQSDVEMLQVAVWPEVDEGGLLRWPALTRDEKRFQILPPESELPAELAGAIPQESRAVALAFSGRVVGTAYVFVWELRVKNKAPRDLFRRFADLPVTGSSLKDMSAVLSFARKWGPLRGPITTDSRGERMACWLPGLSSRYLANFEALCRTEGGGAACFIELWEDWMLEALNLRRAISLRQALNSTEPEVRLRRLFSVEGSVVTWKDVPENWYGASWDYKLWARPDWAHRLPLGSDPVRWGVELLSDLVSSGLKDEVQVRAVPEYNRRKWTGRFLEEVRPLSLAGVLWLQFRDSLFSRRQDKQCSVCGRPVLVKARGRVPDVCGPTCRQAKARTKH